LAGRRLDGAFHLERAQLVLDGSARAAEGLGNVTVGLTGGDAVEEIVDLGPRPPGGADGGADLGDGAVGGGGEVII
jgi:hypothetical protein